MSFLSTNLTDVADVSVAVAGVSVAAPAVPDNCHTVILLNMSTTATIYFVTFGVAGGPLSAASSWKIPPEGSATIPINVLGKRAGRAAVVVDATLPATVQVGYVNAVADTDAGEG